MASEWIIYLVRDKVTRKPYPYTNAPSKSAAIQHFLHKLNPVRFPPFSTDGNIVGPGAREFWEQVAEEKQLEVMRYVARCDFSVEEAEIIYE